MMNEMWIDCWTNTSNNAYPQLQHPVYDEFNLHPMFETTHSYHHPYKPKQRFTQYNKTSDIQNVCNNNIELTCRNSESDQQTSKTIIHHRHLSQSSTNHTETIYQQNGKELSSTSAIKIEPDLEQQQQFSDHNTTSALLKTNNKKIPGSTTVNVLCLVCGDQASGFHYGVNSCEGCKGFFRRSITQGLSHRCNNMGNCEITPFSRNSCQFCRLKKCLNVGMSREASRLGRRPKRIRFDPTNLNKNVKGQITNSSSSSKISENSVTFINSQEIQYQQVQLINKDSNILKQEKLSDENDKQISPINHISSVSSTTSNIFSSPYQISNLTFPDCLFQHRQITLIHEIHQEILRKLSSMLIYQERLLTDIEIKEIDYITQIIINAHLQYCVCTFEKIQIKIEENPPIWANSINDDLHHDPALVWANWQLSFPLESILRIFKYYTFCQHISQDDQICLFRHGAFETLLVSWFTLFDTDRKLMLTPDFSAYMDRDFIKTIKILGVFMLEIFDLGMKASHLPWTDSDIALFNALLLMNPERPNLCDKEIIGHIEAKLMQVLYRHLRRHHPNEPNLFLDILQLIPLIQEVNQIHLNAVQYIKRYEPQIFYSLPNIHRETYEGLSL